MFYSTVGRAIHRPASLRSIAKYTSHTDKNAAVYADLALGRQWIERTQVPEDKQCEEEKEWTGGAAWRGATRYDEMLPSSWFPANEFLHEYVSPRSHNWIHTDTDRVDV